jgi:hypothetical protein
MQPDCFNCCYENKKNGHYITENKKNNEEKQLNYIGWCSHENINNKNYYKSIIKKKIVHDEDEIKGHLDVITKYLNFITSLNNKHIHKKINVRKKIVLEELIFYSNGTLKRLCKVFNYIVDNFKSHKNFFLTEYRLLRLEKRVSIERICRNSLEMISKIEEIQEIFETILKVINKSATPIDKIFLKMMAYDENAGDD